MDETTAPVLDPGRGKTKTGYLWALARDDRPFGGADPPYASGVGRGLIGIVPALEPSRIFFVHPDELDQVFDTEVGGPHRCCGHRAPCRGGTPSRTLPDKQAHVLDELVTCRNQVIEMMTAEGNRARQIDNKRLKMRIERVCGKRLSSDGALHGRTCRLPPQSRDRRLLSTPSGGRKVQKARAHSLHTQAPRHPQCHLETAYLMASCLTNKTVAHLRSLRAEILYSSSRQFCRTSAEAGHHTHSQEVTKGAAAPPSDKGSRLPRRIRTTTCPFGMIH